MMRHGSHGGGGRSKAKKCEVRDAHDEAFAAADVNGGTGVPGVADSEVGAWLTTGADIVAAPKRLLDAVFFSNEVLFFVRIVLRQSYID